MNKLISKSFLWMFIGLLVTFLTGYIVSGSENMITAIFENNLYWIIFVVEFILVIFFSLRVRKMKATTARICFLLYSFISGLTFSSIFILFELGSVMYIFLISALVFGIFGLIGYFTKIDLYKISNILFMGLIAIIICTIINLFLGNETFDLVISIITLIVFFCFTAYDVQKIKNSLSTGIDENVLAINGAFELYLDFINIFIQLLQFFGDTKD